MRVAVIPPLVTGEDPGATPRIQEVSAVVSPRPDATAFSAASRRARKGAASVASAESADRASAFFQEGLTRAVEKSAIFFSPLPTA